MSSSKPRRREILALGAAFGLNGLKPRITFSEEAKFEPTPDLSAANVVEYISCIRPYREKTFRLEAEEVGAKQVVHNYGHGGGGITVSWGCAAEVRSIVDNLPAATSRRCAVLGSGIMGLTSAALLKESGREVTVYADDFEKRTTSHKAGGQWCPSLIAVGETAAEKSRFDRILRFAYEKFQSLGEPWGVYRRPNYVEGLSAPSFSKVPEDVLGKPQRIRFPFAEAQPEGLLFNTLLIEPPHFLETLKEKLRKYGVEFVAKTFKSTDEVASLAETVVVNCLGYGAGILFKDRLMVPLRGQLILLKPQKLPYLLSTDGGYIFPRNDVMVVGGSVERGVDDERPDPKTCELILNKNRSFFKHE